MNHHGVRHMASTFSVRYTNTMEGFWSLFKRGVIGSYHKVSKDYLPLYVNEFSWRYNQRHNPNAFADLITTCDN